MSKIIPLVIGAGSQKAVVDAAAKALSAAGASFKETAAASVSGAAVGSGLSAEDIASLKAHSSIVATDSAALNPDQTYADAKYVSVRSLAPNPENLSVAPVDRVDKFAKAGIPTTAETELLRASFAKTAAAAVSAATDMGASKVTVLQKPQTAFKAHNDLFVAAVKSAAEGTEVSVDVQTNASVVNSAIMFTKSLGVVVSPDYTAGQNFEAISAGVAGGNGFASTAFKSDDATVHSVAATGNPTALLVAAARALKQNGDAATAGKIEAALKKAFAGKVLPAGAGGNADAAAFAGAVAAAM